MCPGHASSNLVPRGQRATRSPYAQPLPNFFPQFNLFFSFFSRRRMGKVLGFVICSLSLFCIWDFFFLLPSQSDLNKFQKLYANKGKKRRRERKKKEKIQDSFHLLSIAIRNNSSGYRFVPLFLLPFGLVVVVVEAKLASFLIPKEE